MFSTTMGAPPAPRSADPTDRRRRRWIPRVAAASTGLLIAGAIAVPATVAADTTPVNVTVDYSIDKGPSDQVASGFLHGMKADDPPQHLIDAIEVRTIRGADHHPNLPSLFDPATYQRTQEAGAKLNVGVYYYKDEVGNPLSSYRPGDNGDWDTWRQIVTGVVTEAKDNNFDVSSWITWNEPNLQWNSTARPYTRFLEAHKIAHDTIKSIDPDAKVQGPEVYSYNKPKLTEFLTYCKQNDCLPELLTWHELSATPTAVPQHVSEITDWMKENGIEPMPISITEYQGQGYGSPSAWHVGQNVRWLAQFERAVPYGLESALVASWEWDGQDPAFRPTLGNAVSRDLVTPRGVWWNLNAYRDMSDRLVQTTSGDVPEFTGPEKTYEAESALMQGAVVASNWGGYTGTGFWNPQNASGDWVEFSVDAPAAGRYTLFVRNANGGTANRPLSVTLNGQVVATPPFAPTGGWSTWKYETLFVDLAEGKNTVRFTNTGSRGPNIDHLGVSKGEVTIAPAAPVDALTGLDKAMHRSVTLVGNQTSSAQEVNLKLTNIPAELIRADSIRVRASIIPNTESVASPVLALDEEVTVVDGKAEVPVSLPAGASARIDVVPSLKDAAVFRLEAEDLAGTAGDGVSFETVSAPEASGGKAVALATSGAESGVSFQADVPEDGVYRVNLGSQTSPGAGTAQLYVDGEAVGGPIERAGAETFDAPYVGVVSLSKGAHQLEVREVGDAGPSSLTIDHFELTSLTAVTKAGVPQNVTAAATGDTSITVSWSASDPTGPGFTGYRVYEAGGSQPVCETAETSCVISGLALGSSHAYEVVGVNARGEGDRSPATAEITLPEVASNDGAKSAPGKAVLSSNDGWDTGLKDGTFQIAMDLWWGQNGSLFKLYQDGVLVAKVPLAMSATSAAQHATVDISGLKNGTYVFTGELLNSKGSTATQPLTVKVTDASPGKPALSSDNYDRDGNYTVTADLWWGTNATSYRFLEAGVEVGSGQLAAASPSAQKATLAVTGKAKGTYTYTVEFTNAAGTTVSAPLKVTVSK
jgi:hypothetical protein